MSAQIIQHRKVGWIAKWKTNMKRSGSGILWRTIAAFAWRDWGKQKKRSAMIVFSAPRYETGASQIRSSSVNHFQTPNQENLQAKVRLLLGKALQFSSLTGTDFRAHMLMWQLTCASRESTYHLLNLRFSKHVSFSISICLTEISVGCCNGINITAKRANLQASFLK
jgi:hypothetical protein